MKELHWKNLPSSWYSVKIEHIPISARNFLASNKKKKTFQLNHSNVCLVRPTILAHWNSIVSVYCVWFTLSWWKRKNQAKRKPSKFHGPVRSIDWVKTTSFVVHVYFFFSLFPVQQLTSVFLCLLVKFHFSTSINWISCAHKSNNNSHRKWIPMKLATSSNTHTHTHSWSLNEKKKQSIRKSRHENWWKYSKSLVHVCACGNVNVESESVLSYILCKCQ